MESIQLLHHKKSNAILSSWKVYLVWWLSGTVSVLSYMIYCVHYALLGEIICLTILLSYEKKYTGVDTDLIPDCEYEAFPEFFTVRNTLHKSNKCINTLSFDLQHQIW